MNDPSENTRMGTLVHAVALAMATPALEDPRPPAGAPATCTWLDALSRECLLAFWAANHRATRRQAKLLVGERRDAAYCVQALSNYASNRAAQLLCRELNDDNGVAIYERCADLSKARLPESLR